MRRHIGSWFGDLPVLIGILALASVGLIVLGLWTQDVIAGAGLVLFGAVFTAILDVAKEQRAAVALKREARRKDLDETRRLLLMALAAAGSAAVSPELVGTLESALVYHQEAVNPQEATTHVKLVLQGDPTGESTRWIEGQIARINNDLGRLGAT